MVPGLWSSENSRDDEDPRVLYLAGQLERWRRSPEHGYLGDLRKARVLVAALDAYAAAEAAEAAVRAEASSALARAEADIAEAQPPEVAGTGLLVFGAS